MHVEEHTIELEGSPAFFRTAESPGLPTVYLHGIPTSSDDWLPFLERGGGLAPDLIGFGRSGKGGHLDYSREGHADFLENLLAHLRIRAVNLVAHDWGAAPAVLFAQRHPDRVRRLVLINPSPPDGPTALPRFARLWRKPVLGELAMGSITRSVLKRELRAAGPLPDEQIRTVWEQFDQGTQRAILRLYRRTYVPVHIGGLKVPALLLWGECDPWLPASAGDEYAAILPHVTRHRVQNARHWPWLQDPSVIDQAQVFLQASG